VFISDPTHSESLFIQAFTSNTMAQPFIVTAPFASDPSADVILRSSDNVEFQAVKGLLSYASPIFKDMFSLPQTTDKSHPNLPCVDLSGPAFVVDMLLRYVYPAKVPTEGDNEQLFAVYEAAQKYEMARVLTLFKENLKKECAKRPQNALLLYIIACVDKDEKAAVESARECLRLPYLSLALQTASVNCFPDLLLYHHTVSAKVAKLFSDAFMLEAVFASTFRASCYHGDQCRIQQNLRTPLWWQNERNVRLCAVIENGPLSEDVYSFEKKWFSTIAFPCVTCTRTMFRDWSAFEYAFKKRVEDEANKVNLLVHF